MSAKDLRLLITASPFRPFSIVTTDDVRIDVREPAHARVFPDGSLLVYSHIDETMKKLPEGTIKEVFVQVAPTAEAFQRLANLRGLRNARPFNPFYVVRDDGRRFSIEKPYHVGIAPGDREICIAAMPSGFERIPVARIAEVQLG